MIQNNVAPELIAPSSGCSGETDCTCVVCIPATWSNVKTFGSGRLCMLREVVEFTSRQWAWLRQPSSRLGSGGRTRTNTRILSSPLQGVRQRWQCASSAPRLFIINEHACILYTLHVHVHVHVHAVEKNMCSLHRYVHVERQTFNLTTGLPHEQDCCFKQVPAHVYAQAHVCMNLYTPP